MDAQSHGKLTNFQIPAIGNNSSHKYVYNSSYMRKQTLAQVE